MPIALVLVFIFNFNNVFGQQTISSQSASGYNGNIYHSGGNLGIGTSSPQKTLELSEIDSVSIRLRTTNDGYMSNPCKGYENYSWDITNRGNLAFNNYYTHCGNPTPYITRMSLSHTGQLSLGTESPVISAIMQLESTDRGLLLPRLTTVEKEAINSPANGLLVYDTDLQTLSFYDVGIWKQIAINSTFNDYLTITNFNNSPAGSITNTDKTNWSTAHAWGNHTTAGYLTSYIETDPVFTAWDKTTGITISESQITNFGTYLTSYTETDPDYNSWDKDYDDLTNKPSLFNGQWNSLEGIIPNISAFPNDVGYITEANVNIFWTRGKGNTILLNENDNIGIGTETPKKAIHIFRKTNSFNSVSQSASLRLENYNTGGISSEGVFYAWDFENNNRNLTLNFGQHSEKTVNNTERKFTFASDGTLTATKFIGDGSGMTNLNIPETIWQLEGNNATFNGDIIIGDGASKDGNSESIRIRTNNEDWYVGAQESSNVDASGFFIAKNAYPDGTFHIKNNGNIGIGTTSPTDKLEIAGSVRVNGGQIKLIRPETTGGWARGLMFYKDNASARWAGVGLFGSSDNASLLYMAHGEDAWSSGNGIYVKTDGSVGIGTANPDEKLTVKGTVKCRSVKVNATAGADFVFEPDYKLMPLENLEEFVKTKKHLPEIASEKEMLENGLDLGENNIKLLQKIEELTLYIIELNKRIGKLENENVKLDNR